MKFPLLAALCVAAGLLAGCGSLDNPFGSLFRTGQDERVYNPQTGQYEWPKDQKKRPAGRTAGLSGGAATPAPESQSDGRYYDAAKNQWVEVREERSAAAKPKKLTTATPTATTAPAPAPAGAPPPVQSPRARGTYNASTGQIDWNDFNPPPSATPAPKKKSWYWPF